jgi:protein-arginine deiminase
LTNRSTNAAEGLAMRVAAIVSCLLFLLLVFAGCNDRDSGEYGFIGKLIEPPGPSPSGLDGKYNLAADNNRDGVVDTGGTDDYGENTWGAGQGAVMLYNNDDDDNDGARDHSNTTVDNIADELDLAGLLVKQIPDIDAGSYAEITVDADTGSYVRLFRDNGASWSVFDPGSDTISSADLAAGNVTFGIEACHYAETATGAAGLWSGTATLTMTVKDSGGIALGSDTLQIRTAPFLLPNHTCTAERLYICNTGTNGSFVSDMTSVASTIGIPLTVINNTDRWTQDQFEIGFVDTPTDSNPVVLNSPRNPLGSTLDDYAWNYMLGPDFGCLEYGSDPNESLNSFGNLDCIPPYGSYPLGRVIVGGAGSRRMEAAIRSFLSAQSIQGPVYELDTTWLAVGHVDEIMSFLPAPNARGWVVGWADVDAALDILQALPGSTAVFAGTGDDTTVSAILNDVSLMDFNDQVQAVLDTLKSYLKVDLGLAEADFVKIPVLWEPVATPTVRALAYTAGAVNWIVVRPNVIVAKQHGPVQSSVDKFEEDITAKLLALGLTAHYVEDWASYHKLMGEVHCGSNTLRTPPAAPRWWTTGK